mgnify:CR=1 FL=1
MPSQRVAVLSSRCFVESLFRRVTVFSSRCFIGSLFCRVAVSSGRCFFRVAVLSSHCFVGSLLFRVALLSSRCLCRRFAGRGFAVSLLCRPTVSSCDTPSDIIPVYIISKFFSSDRFRFCFCYRFKRVFTFLADLNQIILSGNMTPQFFSDLFSPTSLFFIFSSVTLSFCDRP